MREFFAALQSAANNPLDTAARQFVLSSGEAMTQRFDSVATRLEQQRVDLDGQLAAGTVEINELTGIIAETNRRIALLQDGRDADGLNAMIDQRDNLLKELSSWVSISTSELPDGQINVFVGKGQSLVLGSQNAQLEVDDRGSVLLSQAGTQFQQDVTGTLRGGELGGLLNYRDNVLEQTQSELGHLAASLAFAFNEQHHLGVDLRGQFGGDFFRDINDPSLVGQRVGVIPGEAGASAIGQVNVYIDDPLAHDPSNYALRVESDGAFSVTRQSDGAVVFQGAAISPPMEIMFDGIRVEFANGRFNPGDSLLISPYGAYGTEMEVILTDPSAVALGSPVALAEGQNNNGSATISVNKITDPSHPIFSSDTELVPPLLVRFVSDTQYQILDNTDPTNPRPLEPDLGLQNYLQGSQNHILPYVEGTRLVTSSGPQVGGFATAPTAAANLSPGVNGYPAGQLTVTQTLANGNAADTVLSVAANSSAAQIAEQLNTLSGVKATAKTQLKLSELVSFEAGTPVEIAVNGELISGFRSLNELADAINSDSVLSGSGIVAASDGQTLTLTAMQGDDLTLHFQGDPNESIMVEDGKGAVQTLNGSTAGQYESITAGGNLTVVLEPGFSLSSALDGVFAAQPVHQRADFGVDLVLSGNVAAGDEFTVAFNKDARGDNRNAQALNALSDTQLIGQPPASLGKVFAGIILEVGAAAGQAEINRTAASSLLEQSESYRESVSGVNLDEEAANLIKFEQAYNASAQIISVARDTFNVLLNAF